jgi:RNA polymerase sigma-70 factor (family 1)
MKQIPTDNEIIAGLREGSKMVIDQMYKVYHKRIFAFAFSLLKIEDDALDIVHEVFIKLWEHRHNLESNTKIEPLIFTIARNTVLSLFRKRASETKYQNYMIIDNKDEKSEASTENMAEYSFLKEKVDHLVEQLPQKSQRVYILSREKGLSNKEIAGQLKIAEKTVEDHITRSLTLLKKHLRETGIVGMLFWFLFIG